MRELRMTSRAWVVVTSLTLSAHWGCGTAREDAGEAVVTAANPAPPDAAARQELQARTGRTRSLLAGKDRAVEKVAADTWEMAASAAPLGATAPSTMAGMMSASPAAAAPRQYAPGMMGGGGLGLKETPPAQPNTEAY